MAAVASNRNPTDRNAEATVHIAQLDDKVTDAILWELMVQAGPVRHVYIPRNRITGSHYGYGFCEFHTALDALYASKVLNMVRLYDKPIRISQSTIDKVSQDVGANLFVGNLVEEVDEKLLHDAFSAFGPLIEAPYIMRNLPSPESKRYGFIKFGRFDHADAAIAAMNGQYICNHPISVQFAFKKDSDSRERHGSHAERVLAARGAQNASANALAERLRPNTLFADAPASRRPQAAVNPAPPQQPQPQPQPQLQPHPVPQPYGYQSVPPPMPQYPLMPYPRVPPPVPVWQQQQQQQQQQQHHHQQQQQQQQQQLLLLQHQQSFDPALHPPTPIPPYGGAPQQHVQIGWSRNRPPMGRPPHVPAPGMYGAPPPPYTGVHGPQPVADDQAPPPPPQTSSQKQ